MTFVRGAVRRILTGTAAAATVLTLAGPATAAPAAPAAPVAAITQATVVEAPAVTAAVTQMQAAGYTAEQAQMKVLAAYRKCRSYGYNQLCAWSDEFYGGSFRIWRASVSGGRCFNAYHWGWGARTRSVMVLDDIGWDVNDYRCWHADRGPSLWVRSGGQVYALGRLAGRVSSFNPGG